MHVSTLAFPFTFSYSGLFFFKRLLWFVFLLCFFSDTTAIDLHGLHDYASDRQEI